MSETLAGGQNIVQVAIYIDQLKRKYSSLRQFIAICEINHIENCEHG